MSREIREEIGNKRYERACERLNQSEKQQKTERWLNGKKVVLKKDVAERMDHKEKCEKPKTYFMKK